MLPPDLRSGKWTTVELLSRHRLPAQNAAPQCNSLGSCRASSRSLRFRCSNASPAEQFFSSIFNAASVGGLPATCRLAWAAQGGKSRFWSLKDTKTVLPGKSQPPRSSRVPRQRPDFTGFVGISRLNGRKSDTTGLRVLSSPIIAHRRLHPWLLSVTESQRARLAGSMRCQVFGSFVGRQVAGAPDMERRPTSPPMRRIFLQS
jgi:hypothetical protein